MDFSPFRAVHWQISVGKQCWSGILHNAGPLKNRTELIFLPTNRGRKAKTNSLFFTPFRVSASLSSPRGRGFPEVRNVRHVPTSTPRAPPTYGLRGSKTVWYVGDLRPVCKNTVHVYKCDRGSRAPACWFYSHLLATLGTFFFPFDTSFDTLESFMRAYVFMNTKVGRFTAADRRNHFAVNKFERLKKAISASKRAEASLVPGNIPEVFWHSRGHEQRQKNPTCVCKFSQLAQTWLWH